MSAQHERDLSTLGARLDFARELEGRTQGALETELIKRGLMAGRGGISRLINGKRGSHYIDPHLVSALAKILHINFEWLATGEGPMRRDGRIEQTPFEQAMTFARQVNCREDAIQAAWERHKDRAAELGVHDWANLIQAEANLLNQLRIPRPEQVVEKQLATRRAKQKLEDAKRVIIPVEPPEARKKAKTA